MKKLMLLALGFAGMTIASCQRDVTIPGIGGSDSDVLTLRYTIDGHATGATRAAAVDPEAGEENIGSLYLLFYSPSADRSGTYQSFIKLDGPLVMNQNIRVDMSTNSNLNATDAYKILAVANLEEYAPYMSSTINEWLNQLEGQTENYAYKQVAAYIDNAEALDAEKLIMTGETSKGSGGLDVMQLTLTRGVVRFDVVNSARASYDLVSVSIWNAFPELNLFGGGLTDYTKNRIQRFYGVDNSSNIIANDYLGDIYGGLYTFPNQVSNPEDNDTKTTCLIIGLRENGTATTTYHRINISAEDAMQNLKRNNVYRLTIRSVSGDGAGTEMEAYSGGTNEINYQINYWELDDDGLIQQNGNIILAIPTKRIKMGADAEERSYDIFAFGGAANEQIAVSTSWDSDDARNNINVTQVGNKINISAAALMPSGDRTGTITITYAGLTATISVIQTGTANRYLTVTTSSGAGVPSFPGFAGAAMDGTLTVEASGNWTATIYNLEPENFSFTAPNTYTGEVTGSTGSTNLNLYTFKENTTTSSHYAFVSITLDDDPDTHSAAVVLTQKALGSLAVSPSLTRVEWNGLGALTTTGGISSNEFKFNVIVTRNETVYDEWECVLSGANHNDFEIVEGHSTTDLAGNWIIVKANGETTAGSLEANLRIQLENSSATGVDIKLVQTGYTMGVTQPTTPVSNKGGESTAVTVSSNGATLTWSAKVISTKSATGVLTNHDAYVVNGTTGTILTSTDKLPLASTFKVAFPKLLYGNHKLGVVTATVEVELWSGSNSVGKRTITATQSALNPKNVSISNYNGSGASYGSLYATSAYYNTAYRTFLTSSIFSTSAADIPAYPDAPTTAMTRIYTPNSIVRPTSQATATPVSSTTTYLHSSRSGSLSATLQSAIETWRAGDYGVLLIDHQNTSTSTTSNLMSTLRNLGAEAAGNCNSSAAITKRKGSDKKIRDFIYNKGPFGEVTLDASMTESNYWYADNISQALDIRNWDTAVALVGNDERASIVIDPVNRIVFIGESQVFGRNATGENSYDQLFTNMSNSKSKFLGNLLAYVILTAEYGSHFSDLFVD